MKATFQNTVDILVKAYLNDTLEHGSCGACAVGNIVESSGIPKLKGPMITPDEPTTNAHWAFVFMTDSYGYQMLNPDSYRGSAKEAIDATGYIWMELARIEYAFETAPKGNSKDEWMFNGLMAVVDVLADIHGIDLKEKESAKSLFVKTPAI